MRFRVFKGANCKLVYVCAVPSELDAIIYGELQYALRVEWKPMTLASPLQALLQGLAKEARRRRQQRDQGGLQ